MVLTKTGLIKKLMQGVRGLNRCDATLLVESFFDEISHALICGDEIKLSNFGNFVIRNKKPRPGRNLKTGNVVLITARRVVTFHPSQLLKEKITQMQEQK